MTLNNSLLMKKDILTITLRIFVVLLFATPFARLEAADFSVDLREEAIEKMAGSVTLSGNGHYRLRTCFIWCTTWYEADYTWDAKDIDFEITSAGMTYSTNIEVNWGALIQNKLFSASGTAYVNYSGGDLVLGLSTVNVPICFNDILFGFDFCITTVSLTSPYSTRVAFTSFVLNTNAPEKINGLFKDVSRTYLSNRVRLSGNTIIY